MQRLDAVQKSGNGWRARCPACGGTSRKLTVAEREGRVLLHCFGGCQAVEVLQAVGLSWGDIMPPRNWPESPEERRQARRAIRETGWSAALKTLAMEATVALIAARQLGGWQPLSVEDDARLALAVERIDHAAAVFVEAQAWRPRA
ncbi:MAG: DNA primase [Pseudomonadota bacterium]|nr:DNA primase [Pseudomonadota bacterium]